MSLIGKKVRHKIYGEGIIVKTRFNEFYLLVNFLKFSNLWVRKDECKLVNEDKEIVEEINQEPKEIYQLNIEEWQVIESIRMGIVPYNQIEKFTFGRDQEIQKIKNWLRLESIPFLTIIGEYGSGKTHLLYYTYYNALFEDYAVSFISIDANETPFYKPKSIYYYLVKNFKYKDKRSNQVKGFRDFILECLKKGVFKDHYYFRYLYAGIDEKGIDESVWNWIEGSLGYYKPVPDNNFYRFYPGLYEYSTAVNIYCYLISSLGWATKEVLGLKGLLIIFDEFENINDVYFKTLFGKNFYFFLGIILIATNDEKALLPPNKSKYEHCKTGISREVPYLYKIPSNLKYIFADTIVRFDNIFKGNLLQKIFLENLKKEDYLYAFKNIYEIYCKLYNFVNKQETIINFLADSFMNSKPRDFVKFSVEILDLLRHYGLEKIENELGKL